MKNGLCYFSQGQWCYEGWCSNGKIVFLHCARISKSKVQQQPVAWYHFLISCPTNPLFQPILKQGQPIIHDASSQLHKRLPLMVPCPGEWGHGTAGQLGLPSTEKMLEVDQLQQVFHTRFPWRLQMNSAWANLPWFNIPAPQTAKLWLYKYLEKMFHISSQHLSLVTSVRPESVHCQWICPPPPWSWQSPQHPVAAQSHCLLPPCTKKLFNS